MLVLLCCTCTNIGSLNYTDFNQLTLCSAIEVKLQQQQQLSLKGNCWNNKKMRMKSDEGTREINKLLAQVSV